VGGSVKVSGVLERRTPLARVAMPRRSKPLRARSVKTAARDARYSRERVVFLAERPICEAGLDSCSWVATQVHHMAGRAPSVFFRQELWLPVCGGCHGWITDHPGEAFALGLSVHRIGIEVGP
jgi:hypothetical protein